jgi:hypothetical protein
MSSFRRASVVMCVGAAWLCLCGWHSAFSAEPAGAEGIREFLCGEDLRPQAGGLKIWPQKETGAKYHEGERLTVTLRSEERGYLVAVGIDADSSMSIVFPELDGTAETLEKGKVYTVFGDDSKTWLRLGKPTKWTRIIFFVTPEKLNLDELTPADQGKPVFFKPATDSTIAPLKAKLAKMAGNRGFFRAILPLEGPAGQGFSLEIAQASYDTPRKALPAAATGSSPESVSGVQGHRPANKTH